VDRPRLHASGARHGVICEFAYHEGNYAIEHTLRGARMQELEASRKSSATPARRVLTVRR